MWGWILRLTVGISFIFLPIVVNSVNPVVNNLPLATPQVQEFLVQHADWVAFAQKHAELLTLVQKHEAVVERASVDPSLPNLLAVAAAIGTKNALELNSLKAQFEKLVVPYQKQLSYLSAHQKALTQLQNGVNKSPKQWQHWFWICIGGIILFIPTIFINRGRWSPKRAREDEEKRKAEADAELKTLVGAGV